MGVQTPKVANSVSDGVRMDVSSDSGSTWLDCGVMDDGMAWTYDFETSELEWGNAENPDPIAKNLVATVSPSELRTFEPQVIEELSAGLITREVVAGTLVSGATQDVLEGNWGFDTGILLSGQNANTTVPTINSVTGSIDGAGAADDWTTVLLPGGWYLIPLDGTNFTTEAQDLVIDSDYTPAASENLYSGTTSKVLAPVLVRFTHYTDAAFTVYDYRITFYRVALASGGLTVNKLGAKTANDYDSYTISLRAQIDGGLADGRQLYKEEKVTV